MTHVATMRILVGELGDRKPVFIDDSGDSLPEQFVGEIERIPDGKNAIRIALAGKQKAWVTIELPNGVYIVRRDLLERWCAGA